MYCSRLRSSSSRNSSSNVSENEFAWTRDIFTDSRPLVQAQISKFNQLITNDDVKQFAKSSNYEEVKIHTRIIITILNQFNEELEQIPQMKGLVKTIQTLCTIFEQSIVKPRNDHCLKTDKLKSFYKTTQMRQDQISKTSEDMDIKNMEHSRFSKEKQSHIKRTQEKIEACRNDLQNKICNLLAGFDEINTMITIRSNSQMYEVKNLHTELSDKFRLAASSHKLEEISLKSRKQKLDLQLAEWIEKYDRDIGDRECELQDLKERFRKASGEFKHLERTIKKHEIIYNQTVLERDTEEKRIFDEKLYALMSARAAKTLQRAWRTHRAQQKRKKRRSKRSKK